MVQIALAILYFTASLVKKTIAIEICGTKVNQFEMYAYAFHQIQRQPVSDLLMTFSLLKNYDESSLNTTLEYLPQHLTSLKESVDKILFLLPRNSWRQGNALCLLREAFQLGDINQSQNSHSNQ